MDAAIKEKEQTGISREEMQGYIDECITLASDNAADSSAYLKTLAYFLYIRKCHDSAASAFMALAEMENNMTDKAYFLEIAAQCMNNGSLCHRESVPDTLIRAAEYRSMAEDFGSRYMADISSAVSILTDNANMDNASETAWSAWQKFNKAKDRLSEDERAYCCKYVIMMFNKIESSYPNPDELAEAEKEVAEASARAVAAMEDKLSVSEMEKLVYAPSIPAGSGKGKLHAGTYRDAIREALSEILASDSRAFLLGEDIGKYGGCFGVTAGLIDKYPDNHTGYLLPIIRNSQGERKLYNNALHYVNYKLKHLSGLLDIHGPLTMYVARHSWASVAKSKNIPISIISEGMGHDSESTTQIYLASLDNSVIDKANEMILSDL